jgi:DNA-3-methyladenine glycosylase
LSAPPLTPLKRSFYERSASRVAPDLLGHWLLRREPSGWTGGPIVETEAYLAKDAACHAANGPTRRNRTMFGPPGMAYVYFIYGVHYCVNAVCLPPGHGEAVLIRAIEPRLLPDVMRQKRRAPPDQVSNGPGKLCAALAINLSLNGADLCDLSGGLVIVKDTSRPRLKSALGPIVTATRVGITKAADLPLRFYLASSEWVSRRD